MGDKISFSSASMKLMESEQFPLEDAVLYAVLANENISNSVTNVILEGMSTRIESFRRYAKNEYTLGLPQGSKDIIFTAPKADIAAAISDAMSLSNGVEVDLYLADPLTIYYILLPFLIEDRGYNSKVGEISIFPTTMEIPTISSTGAAAVNRVLLYNLDLEFDIDLDVKTATITYEILTSYVDSAGEVQTDTPEYFEETRIISNSFTLDDEYYIASYYELNEDEERISSLQWWYYQLSTEVYPALQDDPEYETESNFLPIIPLRWNNTDMTKDSLHDTPLYKTSKILLKKLQININDLATQLNENPSSGDIDHAYVMFGVNLQTEENASIWYLGEFFDFLKRGAAVNIWDTMNDIIGGYDSTKQTNKINSYSMNHADHIAVSEYGFNIGLTFTGINTVFKRGSIGDTGIATKYLYKDTSGFTEIPHKEFTEYIKNPSNAKVVFKLQVAYNTYKEVTVFDLHHRNSIYRSHGLNTSINMLVADPDNMNFVIPVHYQIAKGMDRFSQNLLYQESLILVLNSYEKSSTAWYQSRWFQFIIMVVAILVFIFSSGTASWISKFLLAVKAGLLAVLKLLIISVLIGSVVNYAMKLLAKAIGPEFAAILSVIVLVVAIAYGGQMGNTSILGKPMPTSQLLLAGSQALMTGASSIVSDQLGEISDEYSKFQLISEAKWSELEEMQDLLESTNPLSFDLLDAQNASLLHHPVTDPEQFYDLTIHIGNIGTYVLDVIPAFHDVALKLPEVNNLAFTKTTYAV